MDETWAIASSEATSAGMMGNAGGPRAGYWRVLGTILPLAEEAAARLESAVGLLGQEDTRR